jgi:4-amino-4-deoxy-L-arabinose transferase-like glycosyltransferase
MRGRLHRLWPRMLRNVRLILASLVLFGLLLVFFFWRLASLTPGLGPAEYAARQSGQNTANILDRGINAPYFLWQHSISKVIVGNEFFSLRLSSVLIGLGVLAALYSLLRNWFGRNTAIISVLIFSATPWFVLSCRTAGPDAMYFWPIVLLAIFYKWLKAGGGAGYWWIALCAGAGIGLYTPGIVWLVLIGSIVLRRSIRVNLKKVNLPYMICGIFIGLVLLVPLVQALAAEPTRLKVLFLIPPYWPNGVEILKSIGWSASSLVWRLRYSLDITVDRLALFNILQVSLAVFGAYALSNRARRLTLALAGLLLFSILAAGLNHNTYLLSLGMLSIAVFLTAGLRFLYIEWRRIFPLNPFAKALSLGLISLVVATHVLYCLRYSLIAWPNTEATKSAFVLK